MVPAADIPVGSLDNCDHVAFQHTNRIQPHVVFLNVDKRDYRILNASNNTELVLDLELKDVLNRCFDDQFLQGANLLRDKLSQQTASRYAVLDTSMFNQRGERLLIRVSRTDDRWLFEIEKLHHPHDLTAAGIALLPVIVGDLLSESNTIEELNAAIDAIRQSLDLDHCMLYRFDVEFNGEVLAESCSPRNSQRYLGLRFPTRDVPLSARRMMQSLPIRTAADQTLDGVLIEPRFDPLTGKDIDLTPVRARGSVQSCQSFYANLGVRAKLVLPLEVGGSLWGMITCHHHDPLRISPELDPYLITTAKLMSAAIDRIERNIIQSAERRGRSAIRVLSRRRPTFDDSLKYLKEHIDEFKALIPCGGMILRIAGNTLTSGKVPDSDELASLLDGLLDSAAGKRIATNCLPFKLPRYAALSSTACGALAIPLGSNRSDIAVWLRPEQIEEVTWAGCPNENVHFGSDLKPYLSPRSSFELWKSRSRGTSVAWTEEEIALADSATLQLALLVLGWYSAQASIAKNEFFACISHELRTPLTAILGYADLLSDESKSDSTSKVSDDYVETIRRNGVHLLKVIDDVLDMAKIESGKLNVEHIEVDLETLLCDIMALMRARADEKQLGLQLTFRTNVPKFIFTDPVRLRQILLNLLGNAIKFTEAGNVSLVVSMDAKDSELLAFEVVDSGIGMTSSQISRLFQVFSQADSTTTRRFGGSGLGLMISKNLAQLLGGDVSVTSVPGRGSKFRVCIATGKTNPSSIIRRVTNMALESISTPRTKPVKRSTIPAIEGKRILLMEDGADNQRLIAFLLGKAGANITIAENGKLGIEAMTIDGTVAGALMTPLPFDLILTDMQMPELDGYTAARMLREKGCGLPIIALTAFAMKSDAEKCILAGCDDYLSKPLAKEEMLNKISDWLAT
jgi:light-regulated signal transduction histidine kinase (bacteriophytochrome)/CheY-like chemotaxis protein